MNSKHKKVLFLALSGIGNLIMQLPAIAAIKKAHPGWHLTVWVAPRGTRAIAESQPFIDEVIEMHPPGLSTGLQGLENLLALRKRHFDIGIVLSPGQLVKSAAYLRFCGIPLRIGNTYPFKKNPNSSLFLNHGVEENPSLHDVEQNLILAEHFTTKSEPNPYYALEIPETNKQEAEKILSSIIPPIPPTAPLLGIHAGCAAGFEWKRWPLDRFAAVAAACIEHNRETRVLLFGGKDEAADKQEMLRMINKETVAAYDISAPLLTTAAVMQKCSFFLSNDSGLMHIAAAVGVQTLGLFGPTDEGLTGPRGKQSFALRAPGTASVYTTEGGNSFGNTSHESLLKISVDMVLTKIALLTK